ncbi:MAG: hypothetical protein ACI8TA_002483 [Cyclobacteriaceae bacterium]|jgi:hypothetical protein
MKGFNYALLALLVLFAFSCSNDQDEPGKIKDGEFSFYITGISQSLTYTFSPSNGRAASTVPEDVKNLTVLILDAEGHIVYEQHYYNYSYYYDNNADSSMMGEDDGSVSNDYYYYENTIPDTLFIPKLGSGDYTILAATADFYYYYYMHDSFAPNGGNESEYPKLYSHTTSEGPIYVGKKELRLEEEGQLVEMEMDNISTKITLQQLNIDAGFEGSLQLELNTKDNMDYSFEDEAFVGPDYDYDQSIYVWIDWQEEKSIYALPKTISSIQIYYYDYRTGAQISQEVDIDPDLTLAVGDAITFKVDVEALLEGAGQGVFRWEDISWNDLGDISVP